MKIYLLLFVLFLVGFATASYTVGNGVITTDGLYTIVTYTSNGTFNVSGALNISVLVVGGGGGGGSRFGGGGGGGGIVYNGTFNATQNYTVIVGRGGFGGVNTSGSCTGGAGSGAVGEDSIFNITKASGGGFGGCGDSTSGGNGGSGGGGAGRFASSGGTATATQGSNGGGTSGTATTYGGGGGGGAGAVGGTGGATPGSGGNGLAYSISGASVYYGGGGGGSYDVNFVVSGGAGGIGGGGKGGNYSATNTSTDWIGQNGTNGLGGGGGGGAILQSAFAGYGSQARGGGGGSGVVIIRFITSSTSLQTNLNVYDEQTLAPINFGASFSNSTYTLTIPTNTTSPYTNFNYNFPSEIVTASFTSPLYFSRTFTYNIDSNTSQLNAYMLNNSNPNAIFVRFHVSSNDYVAIQNANVYVYRGSNLVFNSLTDATGTASTYLDSTYQYQIIVNKTGLPSITSYITPVQNDYYIFLTVTQYVNFSFSYANMSTYLTPDPRILYQNRSTINFTGVSNDRMFNYIGIQVTYNNSLIYNYTNYSVYSATFILNINTSNFTDSILVTPFFKLNGLDEIRKPQIFIISRSSGLINSSGLGQFYSDLKDSGLSNFGIGIALLFIGLLLSAFIAWQFGIGSGIVALLILFLVMGSGVFTDNPSIQPFDAGGGMNPQYWSVFLWIVVFIMAVIAIKVIGV